MNAHNDEDARGEGFLGRWSKRKAEARERTPAEERASEAPSEGAESGQTPSAGAWPEEPAFDLSTLPALDEITAQTKLSDFMRKEVPAALRNAALRKAWAIDPTIRDYVNPAREYAYDWNTPGGVPGNGPIEAGYDALKQVAQALGTPSEPHTFDLGGTTVEGEAAHPSPEPISDAAPSAVRTGSLKNELEVSGEADETPQPAEASGNPADVAAEPQLPRRRHGGAAPA